MKIIKKKIEYGHAETGINVLRADIQYSNDDPQGECVGIDHHVIEIPKGYIVCNNPETRAIYSLLTNLNFHRD